MSDFADILRREMNRRSANPVTSTQAAPCLSAVVHGWSIARARSADTRRDELKRRFRQRALATHPDRGGSTADFIAAVRDYERDLRDLRSA